MKLKVLDESATARFYQNNAKRYFQETLNVDMSDVYERFLRYIPPRGHILDAGSGAGRDTLALMQLGYVLEAFDASDRLAALSSELTGVRTEVVRFQDYDRRCSFDGIWACAALLHVTRADLADALERLIRALRVGGVLFISFKKGSEDRVSTDGRIFTDLDEPGLLHTTRRITIPLKILQMWDTFGQSDFAGRGVWFNAIIERVA